MSCRLVYSGSIRAKQIMWNAGVAAYDAGTFAYEVGVETAKNFERTGAWLGRKGYDAYEAADYAMKTTVLPVAGYWIARWSLPAFFY